MNTTAPVAPASSWSVRDHAAEADESRRLHPETVSALTEAGFPRHFVPAAWGGHEGTFTELLLRTAELAEQCASTAWCAGLWAAHGRFAAYLPPEGRRDLWATSPDVRISAAVVPPSGAAVPTPDGWLLQGEWRCVSGVTDADWLLLAVPEPEGEPGTGPLVLAVPAEAATVLDTWNSTGLRGTGSHSVKVAPLEVPRHRAFPLTEMLRGTPGPGRARCHTVPAHLGGPVILAAPALGAARLALRAWTARAAERLGGPGSSAREVLARSSAEIDAAGLLLERAAHRADTEQGALAVAENRRDVAFVVDLLVTAVERLFRSGGAQAHDAAGELQRCWRDVHTSAAHGALRLEAAAHEYAEAVLGR